MTDRHPHGSAHRPDPGHAVSDLPMLPAVLARILALDPNDDRCLEDLVRLLEEDPPFAVRVLKLVNSAAYSAAVPIISMHDAVLRLGIGRVSELATTAAVVTVFVPRTQGQKNLWIHSLQVALGVRAMVRHLRPPGVDPDSAYLAGLLHDIGRFVMFKESPEELRAVDEHGWSTARDLVDTERELCGYDHAWLGWRACETWNLPEEICHAVRDHHAAIAESHGPHLPVDELLVKCLQIADALSLLLMSPDGLPSDPAERVEAIRRGCLDPSWQKQPLDAEELAQIAPEVLDESAKAARGLGLAPAVRSE